MIRTIAIYGVVLAVTAFVLDMLQYRLAMRALEPEFYAVAIAVLFSGLGLWAGLALTRRKTSGDFARNDAAIAALKLSPRELTILELLAAGHANKEIARHLEVSPNTVKTHIANLFAKLGAGRRTEAIHKARDLKILP